MRIFDHYGRNHNLPFTFDGLEARRLRALPHLTYKDPDQPKPPRDDGHEDIEDEAEESVLLLLNHIYDGHFTSEKI